MITIVRCNKVLHSSPPLTYVRRFSNKIAAVEAKLSNGRAMAIETGRYARMADGAATATIGGTSVLAAAVSKVGTGPPQDFLPLTVEYQQKHGMGGRFPTGYLRKELGDQEILTGRAIDRSVRPMFPAGFCRDTQITCKLESVDGVNNPDVVCINAASAALAVSDIPWLGPVAAVRVGICDDEWLINPTRKELSGSVLDLTVVAGASKTVVMLEGGANNVSVEKVQQAISVGVKEAGHIIRAIEDLAKQVGKKKLDLTPPLVDEEMLAAVTDHIRTDATAILQDFSLHKQSRDLAVQTLLKQTVQELSEKFPDMNHSLFGAAFSAAFKSIFRSLLLESDLRCDGRSQKEVRELGCEVNTAPSMHGTSLFQRGQTQVKCTLVFDSLHENSRLSPLLQATSAKDAPFLLNYDFPQLATNETGKSGIRREIGHGALAQRAIIPVLPQDLNMTVTLAAMVTESNGSSSMATVCGGSLALLDAGVALSEPVAGVAMGLVTRPDSKGDLEYKILTDILGIEDYMGDMDFKIAGTSEGLTALQVDVKLPGVPIGIMVEALGSSTKPKRKILATMNNTISKPREHKDSWPVMERIEVAPHRRSKLIGVGGSNMRRLQNSTGVEVWWDGDSQLNLFAPNRAAFEEARQIIDTLLEDKVPEMEIGAIYTATIKEMRDSGVMVELQEGTSPVLLHNSQLDLKKVYHPSALGLKVGDTLKVRYFGRDENSGQVRISRRALQAQMGR